MEQYCILTYELPNIRCVTCNKPIAHLYETYKQLLTMMPAIEVYETLNLKNSCCRSQIGFAHQITINKPDEYKILGIENEKDVVDVKQKLKPIFKNKTINYKVMPCVPLSISLSSKTTKLNDELYVSYINESIFLAQ